MKLHRIIQSVLTITTGLITITAIAHTQIQPNNPPPLLYGYTNANKNNYKIEITTSEQEKIRNYWTPKRIEEAKSHQTSNNKSKIPKFKTNKTTSIKSNIPPAGEPIVITDLKPSPYRDFGTVMATNDAGQISACSAEFVQSSHTIMTAAHCIDSADNNKHWFHNIMFISASNMKLYSISRAVIPPEWADSVHEGDEDYSYDYAFLYTPTAHTDSGLKLRLGIPDLVWSAIGFQQNGKLYQVYGGKESSGAGEVEMANNPLDDRTVGGAWVSYDNYIVGITSSSKENAVKFSPYFDNEVLTTYQLVTQK